jgi:hypothetical protein
MTDPARSHSPSGTDGFASLSTLPRGARIWVFASDRDLGDADAARLAELVRKVFHVWDTKSPGVRGAAEIRERRFLLVGADEGAACLTGCGIDAMTAWVRNLERESGLRLLDRMTVHFRGADGRVSSCTRAEFRQRILSGELGPATPVFDTAASRSDSVLDGRFELPLSESWHARL